MPTETSISDQIKHFFKQLRPTGLLNLVSIHPENYRVKGITIDAKDWQQVQDGANWVEATRIQGRNCYFTVNPVNKLLATKPKKEDIDTPEYCHVDIDIDIEKHGSYKAAKEYLHAQTLPKLTSFAVTPTFIIDTGNGLGAFWRILDGTAEAVEQINAKLIAYFGGDIGTGNVDRLMRMPSTLNWATAKKIKKGYDVNPKETKILHQSANAFWMQDLESALIHITAAPVQQDASPVYKNSLQDFNEDTSDLDREEALQVDERLQKALLGYPDLKTIWEGTPIEGQTDTSGSGFLFALVGILKRLDFSYRETYYLAAYRYANPGAKEYTPRDIKRAWVRGEKRAIPNDQEMFENAVPPIPPPPIPQSNSKQQYEDKMASDEAKENAINPEIDALMPGDVSKVDAILRKLVVIDRVRDSDTVARRFCARIGEGVAIPTGTIVKDFNKIKKEYNKKLAKNIAQTKKTTIASVGLLPYYENILKAPPKLFCLDVADVSARYVFVRENNAFYDRMAHILITKQAFDMSFQHIPELVVDEEERIGTPSTVFAKQRFCVKVDTFDYWPGNPPVFSSERGLQINTWTPSSRTPAQGDISIWLNHLKWLFPKYEERKYLVEWCAFLYKNQGIKINHNIMIGGAPRIGKDTLFLPLLEGLGQTNYQAIDASKVASDYEDYAVGHKVVVLNEMMHSGISAKKLENKLKPFGAAPPDYLSLRLFGSSAGHVQKNLIQIIANTNYRDAAAMDTGVERWYCVWCAPTAAHAPSYYKALYDWYAAGGIEHVLWFLENQVDVSNFSPSAPAPVTAWREEMTDDTREGDTPNRIAELIGGYIDNKVGAFRFDLVHLNDVIQMVQADFASEKEVRINFKSVSQAMRKCGMVKSTNKVVKDGGVSKKINLWAVRKLIFWADPTRTSRDWYDAWVSQQK